MADDTAGDVAVETLTPEQETAAGDAAALAEHDGEASRLAAKDGQESPDKPDGDGEGDAAPDAAAPAVAEKPVVDAAPVDGAKPDEKPQTIEDVAKAAEADAAIEAWWSDLTADHPDAQAVLNSDAMKAWYAKQSDATKALFKADATPAEVARGLYRFKAANVAAPATGDAAKSPAATATATAKRTFDPSRYEGVVVQTSDGPMPLADMAKEDESGYGQVADMIDAMTAHRIAPLMAELEKLRGAANVVQTLQNELNELRVWDYVRQRHQDVDVLRSSGKLEEVAKKLGPGYVRTLERGTAEQIAELVKTVKAEMIKGAAGPAKTAARATRDQQAAILAASLGAGGGASASKSLSAEEEERLGELEAAKEHNAA